MAASPSNWKGIQVDLIGINGLAGAGKDTACQIVLDEVRAPGHTAQRVAFADKMKLLAMSALGVGLLGVGLQDEEGREEYQLKTANIIKESGVIDVAWGDLYHSDAHLTGREYIQHLGEEARTLFGESFWIDQILPNPGLVPPGWGSNDDPLLAAYPGVDVLVVPDVRLDLESDRVKRLGGKLWHVSRPGVVSDGHATESGLAIGTAFDAVLINDGSLDELRDKIKEVLDA